MPARSKLLRALFDPFPTGSVPVSTVLGSACRDDDDMVCSLGDLMVTAGAAIFLEGFVGLDVSHLVVAVGLTGACDLGSANHFATVTILDRLSEALWKRSSWNAAMASRS